MIRGPDRPPNSAVSRHRVVHPRDAALVHQVDDQLELMQHLEVRQFRRYPASTITSNPVLTSSSCAPTQHGLLAEQVGFGLVLERGLDDAGAGAADALRVRERQRLAFALRILFHRNKTRHTLAVDELAAHQVSRPFRRHHADGHVRRRLDQPEVDVEPMPEKQRVAVFEVRLDLVLEDVRLRGVGRQKHDHVGPLRHLRGRVDLEALLGDLVPRLGPLAQSDFHVNAGVAQAQRVRVALAAMPMTPTLRP